MHGRKSSSAAHHVVRQVPADTILERTLWLSDGTAKRPVTVKVGKPYAVDDGNNFVCPFEIRGIKVTTLKGAMGVDSVQALWSALTIIGAALNASAEYKAGRLRWFDDQDDLGFPVP